MPGAVDPWMWAAFVAFILAMLALDLFVLHRDAHESRSRKPRSGRRLDLARARVRRADAGMAGPQMAGQYYAGYLIEKSLSVDNVFVFALVFVLRRPEAVPAPRAVLGRARGARVPRDLHRGRRGAAARVPTG